MGADLVSSLTTLALLAALPALFLVATSYVKISVVLSLLRNALGTGQVPPGSVITALSLILTLYVMAPVGDEIYEAASVPAANIDLDAPLEGGSFDAVVATWEAGRQPLVEFLTRNSGERERGLFFALARDARGPDRADEVSEDDLLVLLPSFLTTELAEAFVLGFVLFVPFLVLDLVVSNVLLSVGMQSLQATSVSLPFKLLLFVAVDGWYVLAEALVTGYG